MKLYAFALLAALAGVTVGCAPDLCSRSSPCPNDPQPTQAQRDQCRASLRDNQNEPCYGEALTVLNCSFDNVVCGADGRTDADATQTRARQNCSNQIGDYTACCLRNPNSGACRR